MSRVMVGLYEESMRPNNAKELSFNWSYMRKYLNSPTNLDVQKLQQDY